MSSATRSFNVWGFPVEAYRRAESAMGARACHNVVDCVSDTLKLFWDDYDDIQVLLMQGVGMPLGRKQEEKSWKPRRMIREDGKKWGRDSERIFKRARVYIIPPGSFGLLPLMTTGSFLIVHVHRKHPHCHG